MGQIRLIGSKEFIKRTREALILLKEKDGFGYNVVIKYLGAIVENKLINLSYFDPYKEVPTAFMTTNSCMYDLKWYAAALVHEAYHGKLFCDAIEENKNPNDEYSGHDAEMFCLTKQIDCLKKIEARHEDILYAIDHYDKEWWVDTSSEFDLVNVLKKIKGEKQYGNNR